MRSILTMVGVVAALFAAGCSSSDSCGGDTCDMECLKGSWELRYEVRSVSGGMCADAQGSCATPPCIDCCAGITSILPADVTGFFASAEPVQDSGNPHAYDRVERELSAPPECRFQYHRLNVPLYEERLELVQESPTELRGTGRYSSGESACDADVIVTRR